MDINVNGYLSFAELELGLKDELVSDQVFDQKTAIVKAF